MIGLILCSRVRSDVGHVTQVCVLPEYRSRQNRRVTAGGNGAEACRSGIFPMLSLTVTEANTRAVALYRRLNFDIEENLRRVCVGRIEADP